jgi:hypothetical protein
VDLSRSKFIGWVFALLLCASWRAQAHEVPPSAMLLDIGANNLNIELRLPLSELGAALELPLSSAADQVIAQHGAMLRSYLLQHLQVNAADNSAYAISLTSLAMAKTTNPNWVSNDWLVANLQLQAPAGHDTAVFAIDYDAIVHQVVTHNTFVSIRHDFRNAVLGEQLQPLGLIGFQQTHLQVNGSHGSWWRGFKGVFAMGMQHIAAGTDHLLFLMVLLLPTPLIATAARWRQADTAKASAWRIVKIVSGFTVGHSITLALAACNIVRVPSQPIEVLIAISIIISAAHAWRPLFAGKESWIATGFGLIHGLAFASALAGFGYDSWVLASSLLGFNLGIETMQLIVIIAVLPWLILMSRSPAYSVVRCIMAGFALLAAIGWIAERAFSLRNPLQPAIDSLTNHALLAMASLAVLALSLFWQLRRPDLHPKSIAANSVS